MANKIVIILWLSFYSQSVLLTQTGTILPLGSAAPGGLMALFDSWVQGKSWQATKLRCDPETTQNLVHCVGLAPVCAFPVKYENEEHVSIQQPHIFIPLPCNPRCLQNDLESYSSLKINYDNNIDAFYKSMQF